MEIMEHSVTFLARDKTDNQLLACTRPDFPAKSRLAQFFVVDEARHELEYGGMEQGAGYWPPMRFLKKSQVTKIRDSKETRALIQELNEKIVWSQVCAVDTILDRITERLCEDLPFTRDGLKPRLDREAVERSSEELKSLAWVYEMCEQAWGLLDKAERIDREVLGRFALRPPLTSEQRAIFERGKGKK